MHTPSRILALMALMRDIEKPSATYFRAVRRATETFTDSPENEAAQRRGNAALLEIEQAVRAWTAQHPDPEQARRVPGETTTGTGAQADGLRDQIVGALASELMPRYGGPQHNTPGGLPLTATAEEAAQHRAQPLAAAVMTVLLTSATTDRDANLREAATALDRRAAVLKTMSSSDYGEESFAARELTEQADSLRRLADEAQQPTGAEEVCTYCKGDRADPDDPGDYDTVVHMHNPGTRGSCPQCHGTGQQPVPAVTEEPS